MLQAQEELYMIPETFPDGCLPAEYENEKKEKYSFWGDERGVGTVEIILILVVLIALVIIFKTQLTSLVNTIFSTITRNANNVLK